MAALGVVLLWTVAPGCMLNPWRDGVPPHSEVRPFDPPADLLSQEALICGALDVVADPPVLRHGETIRFEATFTNCGPAPLRIGTTTCTLGIDGPAQPSLYAAAYLGDCGMGAGWDGRELPAGASTSWNTTWNGTLSAPCMQIQLIGEEYHGSPCPWWDDAPAVRYLVRAQAATWERSHTWVASSAFTLEPWNETHEGWTQFHPAWQTKGELKWQNATISLGPEEHGAIDGATWLYVANGTLVPRDGLEAQCAPEAPGNGTWVRLSAWPCRWAPFPAIVGA